MSEESSFLWKEPCPACGSRDNLARYSDGHGYCFGCEYYEPSTDAEPKSKSRRGQRMSEELLDGVVTSLAGRGISEETCRRYDYLVGRTSNGKRCHIANYRNQGGRVVAQHIRLKGKEFPWVGKKGKDLMLFGQHLVRDGVSKLIITEGEIDAMSVAEALGPKSRFAAVSIISGAKGAVRDIAANLNKLEKADEIILMFDMDEPGREAAKECARLFRAGKVKIADLPLKDANEMLVAGRAAEIVDAIFTARSWRPEGVVSLADVRDKVLIAPVTGLPYWHKGLTDVTYGRRTGELVGIGAGTGVGKTDFLTQQIEYDINTLGEKVGLFFLEQLPFETVRRIAGKMVGRKFHIPQSDDNQWTQEELEEVVDLLEQGDRLRMYDHFGTADYDMIEDTIRYLFHNDGVRIFYIDHLTALAATSDDEKKTLDEIMARLGGLVKELDIWVCLISHLATPEGKPHEEGGRVMIRHFKGSRSIGFWCHFMFGLERNQQAEDEEERHSTTLRVLKDRVSGQATGKTFTLSYDHTSGRMTDSGGSIFGPDDITTGF